MLLALKRWRVTSSAPLTCGPSAAFAPPTAASARASRACATLRLGLPASARSTRSFERGVAEAAPPVGGDGRRRGGGVEADGGRRTDLRGRRDAGAAGAAGEREHDAGGERHGNRRERRQARAANAAGGVGDSGSGRSIVVVASFA